MWVRLKRVFGESMPSVFSLYMAHLLSELNVSFIIRYKLPPYQSDLVITGSFAVGFNRRIVNDYFWTLVPFLFNNITFVNKVDLTGEIPLNKEMYELCKNHFTLCLEH